MRQGEEQVKVEVTLLDESIKKLPVFDTIDQADVVTCELGLIIPFIRM